MTLGLSPTTFLRRRLGEIVEATRRAVDGPHYDDCEADEGVACSCSTGPAETAHWLARSALRDLAELQRTAYPVDLDVLEGILQADRRGLSYEESLALFEELRRLRSLDSQSSCRSDHAADDDVSEADLARLMSLSEGVSDHLPLRLYNNSTSSTLLRDRRDFALADLLSAPIARGYYGAFERFVRDACNFLPRLVREVRRRRSAHRRAA